MMTRKKYIQGQIYENTNDPDLTEADRESVLESLNPPAFHYLRKHGMYVFRFYKNAQWVYVIIDDTLPYRKLKGKDNYQFIFSRFEFKNYFFYSLIEKAYAKLHNCY